MASERDFALPALRVNASVADHSRFLTIAKHLWLVVLATVSVAACSRTVAWDEEVPLNTGQTIWVRRSVDYSVQGGAGNPLDMRLRPGRIQTIEFTWKGKNFRYSGDARIRLLAISPDGQPVLVAKAADNSWEATHRYACTVPFYVELKAQADGRTWTWPPTIESWLYGLQSNLMLSLPPPERMQRRYTTAQRVQADSSGFSGMRSEREIDPNYTGDLCRNTRRK